MNQSNRTRRAGAAAPDVRASDISPILPCGGVRTIKLTVEEATALGIRVHELALPAVIPIGTTHTGRVVAAPGTRETIFAPTAGLVTHVYVKPLQPVHSASPLLRLSVPVAGRRSPMHSKPSAQQPNPTASAAIGKGAVPPESISITASGAATVTSVEVSAGTRVAAGTALLQIAQLDALAVEIQLPASASASWSVGDAVGLLDRRATARITGIKRAHTVKTRVVLVQALIDGSRKSAPLPGLGELVRVALQSATRSQWLVPVSAVSQIDQQAFVFVQSNEGFEECPVTAIPATGGKLQVSGEMKVAQRIAVSGVAAILIAWLGPTWAR